MNKNFINAFFSSAIMSVSLLLLPGCAPLEWFKQKLGDTTPPTKVSPVAVEKGGAKIKQATTFAEKYGIKNDNSPVLARIDGVPVVTKNKLDEQKKLLFDQNPQYKSFAEMIGHDVFDKQLTEALASRALYGRWCLENRIVEKEEYKQECARAMESVEDMLNTKYFSEHLNANATEKDVKEFYDKNKDLFPGIRASAGGVKATGVAFDSEKAAQDFLAKAKENRGDLKKTAQQAAIGDDRAKDWGLVRQDSTGLNEVVKNKIVEAKLFPSIELVKVNDNDVWVISLVSKEEPKYKSLDEIKPQVKKAAEEQKLTEAFEKATQKYRDEYKLQLSEEYFKQEPTQVAPAQSSVSQQPVQAQKSQAGANQSNKAKKVNAGRAA